MHSRTFLRNAAFTVLVLFALVFVALSVDIIVRVWSWRHRFEDPFDVAFLIFTEGLRSVVTLCGVAVAALALRRGGAFTALAFGTVLATIAYTKLIGFDTFPGAAQEAFTLWLLAQGATPASLTMVFGHPEWALWPALAAFLLFAARYPRPLTMDDVHASGRSDRTGAMRSVALAGTDIGRLARDAAAAALRRGWLTARVLVPAAVLIAVVHMTAARSTLPGALVHGVAALAAAPAVAVLVALLRAGSVVALPHEERTLRWLRAGALTGVLLLAVSAVATPLVPQLPLGFTALALAPAAVALCLLLAVLRAPAPRTSGAVAAD